MLISELVFKISSEHLQQHLLLSAAFLWFIPTAITTKQEAHGDKKKRNPFS